MECHNPVDPRQGVAILTVNQQTIWSSPSKQSREGGENWLSVKLAIGKLSSGAQIFLRMCFLWLCMCCSTDLWRASWVVSAKKMNGKILILLIKLNKSSLEVPFVLFFSFNSAEWKTCWCPYRDSWSALDATTFGEKPREKEAHNKMSYVHERTSFFCTDPPHGSCFFQGRMLHSLVSSRLEDCMASRCSAKLAAALTMRISARGQRSTADPAGPVPSYLSSSHPDFCLAGCLCCGWRCVCCGSGGWKESFKDALKITSKELAKAGLM